MRSSTNEGAKTVRPQRAWKWAARITLAVVACAVPAESARGSDSWSIARVWNEEILAAIRMDRPHPPVHARNLFTVSAAMYDAWAAYDDQAVGFIYRGRHEAADRDAARREAISFAAYRILKERYALSRGAEQTLAALETRLVALGYDPDNLTTDPAEPAGVGNLVAAAISEWFIEDGSRQLQSYQDAPSQEGGYVPVNQPLVTGQSGTHVANVSRWQPLAIADRVDQGGFPAGSLQEFLGPQWLFVRPFALSRGPSAAPLIDPGPPPRLNSQSDSEFRENVVAVIRASSEMTPDDGVMMNISPGAYGNNPLGAGNGAGHPLNPFTGEPYAPNVVKRGDFARVLAEFWADGPHSETPPGHWNVLANAIADHPEFERRMGGSGPLLDDLEWDVKVYFALNAAAHEAACAAWGLKRYYDGWRPISAVRHMGGRGQSSDSALPDYHPDGLPLVDGLIELVTAESSQPGQRHQGLPLGRVAILAWPGQPPDPETQHSGARWIRPADWLPYQAENFVTPAFPGYVSGHSTFSRAAAEVLTAMTGSPFFPGGLGTHAVSVGWLEVEAGPSEEIVLQWATYYDAADQAGISRIWGGIHPPADDFPARVIGSHCGKGVWELARRYFDGSIAAERPPMAIRRVAPDECEIRFETVRGFFYKVQSTTGLEAPFADEPGEGFERATETEVIRRNAFSGERLFFRVVRSETP